MPVELTGVTLLERSRVAAPDVTHRDVTVAIRSVDGVDGG